jgi:hypothetical protein
VNVHSFANWSQSNAIHQSPGLEWFETVGVYFKDIFDIAHGILGISSHWRSNLRTDSNNHFTKSTVDAHLQWLYVDAEAIGLL